MAPPELLRYDPSLRRALAAFLNDAYADLRALRPVGIEGPDYPEFTEAGLAAQEASGALAPEGTFVLVEDGQILAAASSGKPSPEEIAQIGFVATASSHRRRGHAAALLAQCEEHARAAGAKALATGPFVDSRYAPACRLFERCGFHVRALDHSNMTMETDIDRWEPREPPLPGGYRLVRFRDGDEQAWCDLKDAVFGGRPTVDWFRRRFRDRPSFDPDGWFFVEREGRKVGIAGAIVWFEDAAMTRPSGSLIEWVGVLAEERGRDLGEALMTACLNYLKGRAVYPNCLVTQYFREAAMGLYEKLGYRVVRECRTYEKALG